VLAHADQRIARVARTPTPGARARTQGPHRPRQAATSGPGARLGRPSEYASLALELCRNAYFNGEDIRLAGAIPMAPR